MQHLARRHLGLLLAALAVTGALSAPAQAQLGETGPRGEDDRALSELYESLRTVERETPESRVAQAVKPSVVYVETEMVQNVRTIFGFQRQVSSGSGSGVVIHPSGFIVTNFHVVEGAQQITVSFDGDPNQYPARLMSAVREEDLALLKIEPTESASSPPLDVDADGEADLLRPAGGRSFPTVRMGTSSDLMPGERVVAIGSPLGQTYTVSTGIISGLYREVPVPGRRLYFRGLIQTDASINRGNSGGPLLNIHGELIGINTVMNSDAENIGFAIPVDRVRQVLTDSLFPDARRSWLGFEISEEGRALTVSRVWEEGPAALAGLCESDQVVSLDGVPVSDGESFLLQSLQIDPGQTVSIGVQRGGDLELLSLEGWDDMNGTFFTELGLTVAERQLGRSRFLMVERVRSGSSAASLGLRPSDVIPAIRPRTQPRSGAIRLSDKATLQLVLDRVEPGTEIEIDAYRDLNGDSSYQRDELLKGVLVR
ncbi:MAG: trypsin-like peptidase domain-containing protein [Planctomycetota bacterium]|nr:trypsin-like peptidase domain-containing protein [Planctomycetota bacterium]